MGFPPKNHAHNAPTSVTDQEKQPKKLFYFTFWIAGLLIPLAAVMLWDSMPRYKAVRKLREAGIKQLPVSVHQAIDGNDLQTLELLHTARVPFDSLNNNGQTPLIASIEDKNQDITDFLTGQSEINCDQPDENGVPPLAHAIMLGNLDSVKKLLLRIQNPNVMIKDPDGKEAHALLKATQERDGTLLRLLLTHPSIDVNVRDETGRTPLHYAIRQDDLLFVRALLSGKQQPDPNLASNDGEIPIDFAVKSRRSGAVELLLENGANPEVEHHARYLLTAIDQGDTETVRHLLAHGASPEANHPNSSITLMNYAMDLSEVGSVVEFLNAGARPSGTLRRAIQCGQGTGAQIIAAHYHNSDKKWAHKESLLELAISSGSPDCIDLLLNHGTDPNQITSFGQRVLPLALASRQERVSKRLLELGADPNLRLESPPSNEFLGFFEGDAKTTYYLKRDRNLTPLMLAALTEQQDSVHQLIAHGAERNASSDRYRRYAVAFAAERHNVPIMQMILGREANDETRKVIISIKSQRATMYKKGEAVSSSRVSTGKRGNRTPKGEFVITNKYLHALFHALKLWRLWHALLTKCSKLSSISRVHSHAHGEGPRILRGLASRRHRCHRVKAFTPLELLTLLGW
ncbi:MAG: ankyrin repeat domain-containing protein [Verrucomicrobiales bacterium]